MKQLKPMILMVRWSKMKITIRNIASSGRSINSLSELKGEFYCGRGSSLGNYFKEGVDGDRNQVCDKFDKMFKEHLSLTPREMITPMKAQLLRMYQWGKANPTGEMTLWCFCAPNRCHTQTIKNWLEIKLCNKTCKQEVCDCVEREDGSFHCSTLS